MDPLDQVFDLLSNERRRYTLYYLEEHDGPITIDEVAEQVAKWEINGISGSVSDEKFKRVKVNLYHDVLPKAAEAKYVEYDPEEGVVTVTGIPPEVGAIITVAKVIERPDRNP